MVQNEPEKQNNKEKENSMTMTATYSPEDNKLRLYPVSRLSPELYARVKAHGFSWAPKQELFVAPMWTPEREDLLMELCGEIGDEDKSLVERAEERAERFEEYSEKRAEDANRAHEGVSAIADNIPLGQPILIGHHSERHARKDAERIENGMRRAVKMWETSKYWQERAAGAIRTAAHKERPDVRARRIKGIEADKRKQERHIEECKQGLRFWRGEMTLKNNKTGEKWQLVINEENRDKIRDLLGGLLGSTCGRFNVASRDGSNFCGWSAYDVLQPDGERYKDCPSCTVEQCREAAEKSFTATIEHCLRWVRHYENRLAYENAMLAADGGLVATRQEIQLGGQVLRRGSWFVVLKVNKRNGVFSSVTAAGHWKTTISADEIDDYKPPQEGDSEKVKKVMESKPLCNYPGERFATMTQEEWDKVPNDSKSSGGMRGTVAANDKYAAHRVRRVFGLYAKLPPEPEEQKRKPFYCASNYTHSYWPVFITDAKVKFPPPADGKPAPTLPKPEPKEVSAPVWKAPKPTKFDTLKETLKAGVQVVSAPQLFPTPPELAKRVCELANLKDGICVLEPSAGTGNLVQAIRDLVDTEIVGVEINRDLCNHLSKRFESFVLNVRCADFLSLNGELGKYERIVMNPPFQNGSDIKHIKHAIEHLADGGRLVAICANGPRQKEELEPLASVWIDLEDGTFKEQGTNVRTALIVIDKA